MDEVLVRPIDDFNTIYKFHNKLGEGSYGNVWKATRKDNSMQCAVKIVNRELDYLREFDHLHDLMKNRCRRILPLQAVFLTPKQMCMELPLGDSNLTHHIVRQSRKNISDLKKVLNDCLSITLRLLTCVYDIHQRHIIHRDIKPDNIIMINGNPRLIDFGLSKRVYSDVELSDNVEYELLTAPFRPMEMWKPCPEYINLITTNKDKSKNAQNKIKMLETLRYNAKVDEWAIGCIIYEYVIGKCMWGYEPNEIRKKLASWYRFQTGNHCQILTADIVPPIDFLNEFDKQIYTIYNIQGSELLCDDDILSKWYALRWMMRRLLVCKYSDRSSAEDILSISQNNDLLPQRCNMEIRSNKWKESKLTMTINTLNDQIKIIQNNRPNPKVLWHTIFLFLRTIDRLQDDITYIDSVGIFHACLHISVDYLFVCEKILEYVIDQSGSVWKDEKIRERNYVRVLSINKGTVWVENPGIYRKLFFKDNINLWTISEDEDLFCTLLSTLKIKRLVPSVDDLYLIHKENQRELEDMEL